jgi:hypothetical protein
MNGDNHIIRTVKDRDNPYVMVSRSVSEDSRLSWEARGVLTYLLGKPDNWQVRVTNLVNAGPGSRERMMRILRELEDNGYLERRKFHDDSGRWVWESVIYEVPPESGFPTTVKPTTVQPTTEKPSIYQLTTVPNNEETITEGSAPTIEQLPPSAEAIVEQWQRTSSLLRGMGR